MHAAQDLHIRPALPPYGSDDRAALTGLPEARQQEESAQSGLLMSSRPDERFSDLLRTVNETDGVVRCRQKPLPGAVPAVWQESTALAAHVNMGGSASQGPGFLSRKSVV